MPSKRVILIIVEGPTDDDALGVIFSKYFNNNTVRVKIIHGDITTEKRVNSSNILTHITDVVKQALSEYKLNKSDLMNVIHLTDTDGTFVSDEAILYDETKEKPYYCKDAIRTRDPAAIIERNRQKRENIQKLFNTKYVWKDIPYQLFYMSCNLEHVLYNKNNLNDDEKEKEALLFAKRYMNNISGFVRFINDPEYAVLGDYLASWKYIIVDSHSLERHTNLGMCFNDQD